MNGEKEDQKKGLTKTELQMVMILLVRDVSARIKVQTRSYVEVNNIDFIYQ